MQITVYSKVRLYPEEWMQELLVDSMHAYRKACNYVSAHIFATQTMSLKQLQKELYYDLRGKFKLKSQMAISVLRTVRGCYKSLDSRRDPWTLIRFNKPQIDLVYNRDYSLSKDYISINTLEERIKVLYLEADLSFEGIFGTAKLIYRHGKFYLNIPVTIEVPDIRPEEIVCIVGIDRGIRFLAVSYDSFGKTKFFSGSEVKRRRLHYFKLKEELKQKGTPSSRKRLKEIAERESRWMKDVNHGVTRELSESYPRGTLFVLEDLTGIGSRTKANGKDQNYLHSSWAFYDFEKKLIYKAALNGQMVIKVDPAYTSQRCPACGMVNKYNRRKQSHLFKCRSCAYTSNDDRVAAINLYSMGNKYLIQSGSSSTRSGGVQSTTP